MPRWAPFLLLLAASCGRTHRFRVPFDAGQNVHFIVAMEKRPVGKLTMETVCTVGSHTWKAAPREVIPGQRFEVAILEVPTGEYVLSIWDPNTRARGMKKATVDRELWAVLEFDPKTKKNKFKIYDEDPHDDIGAWRPLLAVPD